MNMIPHAALLITFAAAMPSFAQPPPDAPPPFHRLMENEAPPGHPASPLQQWMKQLAESDPEEFQRLQTLRMQDPQEFRRIAREKIKEHGLRKLQTERPAIYDAIIHLPEEDRQWLADRLLRPNVGPPPGRRGPEDDGPRRDDGPGLDRSLIRAYKQAKTEDDKIAARDQIRENLSALYDQQLAQRREQLSEAEEKIASIRKALALGEAGKEAFIEEKLSVWLNHADNKKGKRPPPPPGEF
jgi:hypothetical protein